MRLLLDTNVLLWWLAGSRRLPRSIVSEIEDPENEVAVSAVSAWEISIKRQLGKLAFDDDLPERLRRHDVAPLPVSADHAWLAGDLPLHHRDPFDRMLVAQAQLEGFTIATGDPQFARYAVPVLNA